MQPNYIQSIKEHIDECHYQLEQIREIERTRQLTSIEFLALERVLQVLIESAISLVKQWIKSKNEPVPSDAYQGFTKLYQKGLITQEKLDEWKKIIGLRNVIVHDYLKLDHSILLQVLKNQRYEIVYQLLEKLQQT